ncbi:co-chaperone DjlA [Catenovulum sp. 2E275]|uniref:co-chaperone DjlA n=1 Tax=Catenovulum sp. 2E275 TaxID=2980497 RepID=UPI0021D375AA|nr:co-chaperone DjlA [Catenovulum sp. 2E275]MCU4675093.1 co-chaperone DjlA [Catenovulum sp. 2E275]
MRKSNWGKILGLIFGSMMFNIPGAIIGFIIGYYFDKGYAQALSDSGGFSSLMRRKVSLKNRAIFFHSLFSIMGHIAKSSGRVTENDIALASVLMDRMGLNGELRKEAQTAYREGKQAHFPVEETVIEFKNYCYARRDFMLIYLEIQIQAALANGQLHPKARDILYSIGAILGFNKLTIDGIIKQNEASTHYHQKGRQKTAQPTGMSLNYAYQILGIKESDDAKTIKKAYKKLMAQHHPDKLSAQGLPEQALKLAKEKAQDIQAAYEAIKQHKGIK